MKHVLLMGLGLLLWVGNVDAMQMLCDGSEKLPHDEVLSLSSDGVTYLFDEGYDFTDGILGDWASKTYMYVATQWPEMAPDGITLLADEGIWQPTATYPGCILYHFVVPASNATVGYSAFLRMGATLRVAPEAADIWGVGSQLAVGANTASTGYNFQEYSGTIPSSQLKTSVSGETSFWLYVANYNGSSGPYTDAAAIDRLTISAMGDPTALSFSLPGGTYDGPQNVVITCQDTSYIIRYTTDGSEPTTTNGTIITSGSSVLVDQSLNLQARAWPAGGGDPGPLASVSYDITVRLCNSNGSLGHSEILSLSGDGVTYLFNEDYSFTDCVLGDWASKADRYVCHQWPEMAPDGITLLADEGIWQPSATYPGLIFYHFIVPVSNATVDFSVFLRCGATVRVAPTDAGIWGAGSSQLAVGANTASTGYGFEEYVGTIPSVSLDTSVPGETSFWLLVINNNGINGPYTDAAGIDQLTLTAVGDPTFVSFSLAGGVYGGPQNVVITCQDPSSTIRYTTDGSEPTTTNGTIITSGNSVLVDQSLTLQARAWPAGGGDAGLLVSASYTIVTATPTFSPGWRNYSAPVSVTISCSTPGATLKYTTDGTDPSETNGTSITSGCTVLLDEETTLKAKAWSTLYDPSLIKTGTYVFPVYYNRPGNIPAGTATVDGDLSDWADAEWAPLNQPYYGTAADIHEAYYTAKWSTEKVYVAIKVRDTSHAFTDGYGNWNTRDAVEIYLYTFGNGPEDYSLTQADAQQYSVGFTLSDPSTVWSGLGQSLSIPTEAGFVSAGTVDGDWLYYEVAMTPFQVFSLTGAGLIVSPLSANDVIGLDVVASSLNGNVFGMLSENMMVNKSADYASFGLHKLVSGAIPGDANGDGKVDVGDLGILAANYGMTSGATLSQGDFNDDGKVDVGDLGILAANYGVGTSGANWNADYAKAFGETVSEDENSEFCSGLGLPLVAGLVLMGLMLVKLEE